MDLTKLNFKHVYLKEVDSTNRYAIELLSKTNPNDGFCVFSDFQTEGRGQYGRSWESESGMNLLMSFVYKTQNKLSVQNPFVLNKLSSMAVWNVLGRYVDSERVKIKWPNDLLIDGKKIAGILIQNIFRGQEILFTVVGIGLNVNQVHFLNSNSVSSLKLELNKEIDRTEVLQDIHKELTRYMLPDSATINQIDSEYNSKLFRLNQYSKLRKSNDEIIEGIIRSVDKHGMLNILSGNKVLAFDFTSARIIV